MILDINLFLLSKKKKERKKNGKIYCNCKKIALRNLFVENYNLGLLRLEVIFDLDLELKVMTQSI